MKSTLESIFNIFGETATVDTISNNSELFEVNTSKHGKITVCAKGITFGGRENLDYEQRIQIKGNSNNYAFDKLNHNEKAILLGVGTTNNGETVLCSFKLKHSSAINTISKQIKNGTIEKALSDGFAQQLKGNEYACAFRNEFLYFYLNNCDWLHDSKVDKFNSHLLPETTDTYTISQEDRVKGGTNILLYGVPGAGKSHTIETNYCNDFSLMERVVFHPDYMNTDFVGQILPTVKGEGDEKEITYDFTPGPFTRVLNKAINDPSKHYYLVIEEINRGNAPAIFGEIFQLLDRESDGTSSYKITNYNIANEVFGKKETPIFIPSNLSILATMNTADQNVFTLDTAFQRRWNMKIIENDVTKADHAKAKILDTTVTWEKFNTVINEQIITSGAATLSSEDKRLGSYFVTEDVIKYFSIEIDKNEISEKYNINLDNTQKLETVIKDLNSRFGDKVIKYLWDDVFKFSRDDLFEPNYKSLEKVLYDFNRLDGDRRFDVFKQDIKDNLFSDNNIEETRNE